MKKEVFFLGMILVSIVLISGISGCQVQQTYNPLVEPANFVRVIDNKYYPLMPGTKWTYEGTEDGEKQTNEVIVTNQTKIILGVTTTVILDRVLDEDNKLVEETYDWYAQDKDGNVWYFGEDAKDYENGKVISTAGSWEAGKDGALPGIIMKESPKIGELWRQEYLKGEAEDMAQVLAISESITVPSGTYKDCIKTKDWTPLEPDVEENKYYCPNIGVVSSETVKGGSGKSELKSIII
jgi:hypothetical protein